MPGTYFSTSIFIKFMLIELFSWYEFSHCRLEASKEVRIEADFHSTQWPHSLWWRSFIQLWGGIWRYGRYLQKSGREEMTERLIGESRSGRLLHSRAITASHQTSVHRASRKHVFRCYRTRCNGFLLRVRSDKRPHCGRQGGEKAKRFRVCRVRIIGGIEKSIECKQYSIPGPEYPGQRCRAT